MNLRLKKKKENNIYSQVSDSFEKSPSTPGVKFSIFIIDFLIFSTGYWLTQHKNTIHNWELASEKNIKIVKTVSS